MLKDKIQKIIGTIVPPINRIDDFHRFLIFWCLLLTMLAIALLYQEYRLVDALNTCLAKGMFFQ